MRATYTSQFSIEDLFPEPAAETSGAAIIVGGAHRQFLTDAANAVKEYLKSIGTPIHSGGEISHERVETMEGMDNRFLRPQFQELYLTGDGIAVKLDCSQEYDPYMDGERVKRAEVTLTSHTVPVTPLKRELHGRIRRLYETSKPQKKYMKLFERARKRA